MKDSARITHVYRDLPLQFDDKIRSVNALPLDMCEFDIILGIDWLAAHLLRLTVIPPASVNIGDIHAPEFIYHGSLPGKPMKIISALKARTLLSHGCEGFLATIHDTTSDVSSIHDQPIVSEFQDVFPEELPGKRGFIRPSVSPWGAPVLFVKKKDDLRQLRRMPEKSGQIIQNIAQQTECRVIDDGIFMQVKIEPPTAMGYCNIRDSFLEVERKYPWIWLPKGLPRTQRKARCLSGLL
ncbi:putative reverse transcriptase domain-containing protein [Tanacetum coccineum]